ncbi:MAG: DNA primase [Muribaculaceae bacterium]
MIDRRTTNKILKKSKIEDFISDFLSLYRRGNDYVGYCPFHTAKMMTFNVNTSSGTYHCSDCGKTGSIIDFLIDYLHINYEEAIAYMAQRCGIELNAKTERSNAATLYDINKQACEYYQDQLFNSENGRDIALTYYKQHRGFSDDIIQKFHLGYSPARPENTLINQLIEKGYSEDNIVDSGIGVRFDNQPPYDRFHERITFPIFNLAGKIVAFSCRTMKSDPNIAKYKNTNDTPIYNKGNEIYGLFQARKHILQTGYCILVEGNADVVSMHEAGFCNTVAPLGTGFTFTQACVLRRFTDKITLLFDGDNAGLHANEVALQHLLPLGIVPNIVLLPAGDDPDSFAHRLSHDEAQQFITENSINLVHFYFKTKLNGQLNNPIRTAQVAREIIQEIALVPNDIVRVELIKQCSHLLDINEESVLRDVNQEIIRIKEEEFRRNQQAQARMQYWAKASQDSGVSTEQTPPSQPTGDNADDTAGNNENDVIASSLLSEHFAASSSSLANNPSILNKERKIMHYMAKYGMVSFGFRQTTDNETVPTCLIEYLALEFEANNLTIQNPIYKRIFELGNALVSDFYSDFSDFNEHLRLKREEMFNNGVQEIMDKNLDFESVKNEENRLNSRINKEIVATIDDYRRRYFEDYLCSHPDREIRNAALNLVNERFKLSKIHTQQASLPSEFDNLDVFVQDAINNLRYEMMTININSLQDKLKHETDKDVVMSLMSKLLELQQNRAILAKHLGDRVINP